MLNNNSSLIRLIDFDDNNDFKIIVTIKNEENRNDCIISQTSKIIIKTSINKARVISQNINQCYKNDQSIKQYEITLNNIDEQNKTDKIIQAFKFLLNSIGKQITISPDIHNILMIILQHLGESYQQINHKMNFNEIKQIEIISYYKSVINNNGISRIQIAAGNNNDEYRYELDNLFKYDMENINDFYYRFYQHENSDQTPNERYIEFNFKDDKVKIFSIEVETNDFFDNHKSLKIVGSNDHTTWDTLVHCEEHTKLISKNEKHIITLKNKNPNDFYKYIRYVEVDKSKLYLTGVKYLKVTNIKFYGNIITNSDSNEDFNLYAKDDEELPYTDLNMNHD